VIKGFPVLIATRGFTDLTAITPDFVVPSGFLPIRNGSVRLANMPWCTGPVQYAALPTDGVNAYYPDAFGDSDAYVDAAIAVNTAGAKYAFKPSTVPGAIGPGITGAWFDPAQSGHGLFVEVLTNNRFLAWWFAFNPSGTEQTWFGGVGTYRGNTATITEVYETFGGRFIPNFDSSRITNVAWGSLTFTFSDCNHGRVDFSSVSGYGSGSMSLTRLTQPAGLSCP
jgi:hypothetical protein